MAQIRPVRIGPDRVSSDDAAVVRSPYDGHEIGAVPRCSSEDVARAVAAAQAAMAEPFPRPARIEVLETAARLLAERHEAFARTIAEEAAKPLATARIEARRAVDTFAFAAAEARSFGGDVVPLD